MKTLNLKKRHEKKSQRMLGFINLAKWAGLPEKEILDSVNKIENQHNFILIKHDTFGLEIPVCIDCGMSKIYADFTKTWCK